MNKNKIFFYSFFTFFISLITIPLYASNDIPSGYAENSIPDVPPSPIDNCIFIALILGFVYAGYYLFKVKSLYK